MTNARRARKQVLDNNLTVIGGIVISGFNVAEHLTDRMHHLNSHLIQSSTCQPYPP